jgi:hypothetical protein
LSIGCSDLGLPADELLTTSELLALPMTGSLPAPSSFWVYNSRQTVKQLFHADQFNTPYLELEFPPNSLSSVGGSVLTETDSVLVTVDPRPGAYGFTLSPTGLVINPSGTPEVTFFFGLYGDASVAATTQTYADAAAYVTALRVWYEVTVEQWRVVAGSGTAGPDVITGAVTEAGEYVLAAPH